MKRLAVVLAVAASLLWTAGGWAQEGTEPPKPKKVRKEKKDRPKPKQPILKGTHAQMAKVCGLSEDQQKQVAALNVKRNEELKGLMAKTREAKTALAEAKKTNDKDAVKQATTAFRAANAAHQEASGKWWREILGVLSAEQRAKWHEHVVMGTVQSRYQAAKLTDDQLDKLKAAYVEQTTGVDLADDKARGQATAKLSVFVMAKLLTAEQRQTVHLEQAKRQYRRAKLTEAQLEQIEAAYAAQTEAADPADAKAWNATMKKLSSHVQKEILTDQQREAMKPKGKPKPEKADMPAKPKPPAKPAEE